MFSLEDPLPTPMPAKPASIHARSAGKPASRTATATGRLTGGGAGSLEEEETEETRVSGFLAVNRPSGGRQTITT